MGTTLPALDPINQILDTDLFLMTHSTGEGYKLPGSVIKPVDAVTDGDMHAVTSNAVFDALHSLPEVTVITDRLNTSLFSDITKTYSHIIYKNNVASIHVSIDALAGVNIPTNQEAVLISNLPKNCYFQDIVIVIDGTDVFARAWVDGTKLKIYIYSAQGYSAYTSTVIIGGVVMTSN